MATAKKQSTATRSVKPVASANFQSKTKRQRARRGLVQGHVKNAFADARVSARERAEFYANLRNLKMRRRKIAEEMAVLAAMTAGLQRDVLHVGDRYPDVDEAVVDEAHGLVKRANASVGAVADELHAFSRRKVFFTEAVAA